jgi:hypothetical protein
MITYQEIKKRDPTAATLLLLLACFDNRDIWHELIACGLNSICYTTMDLSAQIPAPYSPVTHRRVEVDEDEARDEFAIAKLG